MRKIFKIYLKSHPLRIAVGGTLFVFGAVLRSLGVDVVSFVFLILALSFLGLPVFLDAVKGIIRLDFLDEKFLMTVASVGAVIIGETVEGVAVMLFFTVGEWFEQIAVKKSRKSIKSLMDIRPDTATVLRNGEEVVEDAEDVAVGETIIVRSGERVPLDSEIISGSTDVDTSSLTGESLPVSVSVGDVVNSGVVLLGGVITCKTLRTADNSAASRILELVENASDAKSKEENFITKFSRIYTPTVTILAVIMAIFPAAFGILSWSDSVYRALSFLVVSCPCALVISVPMAFFGGIGSAASEGILFKGGNVFSPLSRAKHFVFDKTGTLTKGELSVSKIECYGITEDEFLYLAASCEYASAHPIAESLKRAAKGYSVPQCVKEISGKGVVAEIDGSVILLGNKKLMSDYSVTCPNDVGGSVLLARDGELLGWASFTDLPKDEAKKTVELLRKKGASRTYVLSGDKKENVLPLCSSLGIDEVKYELLPEDKYANLRKILDENKKEKVVYVGDGINDTPCLAGCDVGISMGDIGSDCAIEASDVVIMSDDLLKIPRAVSIARRTLAIAKQNIVFAIGVKVLVLILASFNIAGMWLAVFADVGVAVLAILNSMRLMIRKKR